jgi:Domain of unknown function (DUF4282)
MTFCMKCGGPLNPGAAFCPACGAAPSSAAVPPLQPPLAQLPMNTAEATGFIGALFDLSFTSFITTKLIKVLYILGIVGAACWALVMAGTGISQGGAGLFLALLSPVLFLAGVIYMRVMMEMIMVIFRASEHVAEIARQGRKPGY